MTPRLAVLCVCLLSLPFTAGCGAFPFWLRQNQVQLPPEAFTDMPNMEDVIYTVNANTDRVEQLQTKNATLRVNGVAMPALRMNMAYQRPRNFRLRAQLSQFTGRELDLGSNNELFWFWIRRAQQPGVYFARHDQFAASPVRELIPVEPHRLPEALGLVRLDPSASHVGPTLREDLLEVRSRIPSPRGDLTRVILLDSTYGWIVEQHYYDPNGQLLLSSRASRHRYYPNDAVTMPHRVQVQVTPGQPAQLAFEIEVGQYIFNRLSGERSELWALPQIDGVPTVDITAPDFRPPVAAGLPAPRTPVPTSPTGAGHPNRAPGVLPARPASHSPYENAGPAGPRQDWGRSANAVAVPEYRGYH